MILIDVGNTSTSYAVVRGGRLTGIGNVATDSFPKIVRSLLKKVGNNPNRGIVISSVVPNIANKIAKIASRIGGYGKIWVVGRNIRVPIKHKYKYINRLGSDRLVNAYGASRIYGSPVLILDYGTALTCDFITQNGVFQGGLIIPGPEIALKALSERTALLPKIGFPRRYSPLLGRDTVGGMKAGILQGYGAMTDGLVWRFRRRFGRNFTVVATGGLARVVRHYSREIDRVDPLLTLKSLLLVFKDRVKIPS